MFTITAGNSQAARYDIPSCIKLTPGLEEEVMTRVPDAEAP
jgi:hypothetical protein